MRCIGHSAVTANRGPSALVVLKAHRHLRGKEAENADQAAAAERAAKEETKRLLAAQRARVKGLEDEKRKLSTKLK